MQESNLILLSSADLFKCFISFFHLSLSLSFLPIIPSMSLHAVSRRTLSEVRSESASVCRQPWQPCPNWPMAWQYDCQLLSVRAVQADRQQGWTAPDGSFRYEKEKEKNLFSPFPVWALKSISWENEALVGVDEHCAAWDVSGVCLYETLLQWKTAASVIKAKNGTCVRSSGKALKQP